ncbi:hypothetical protein ON010_g17823 [Phytophthora cinnamomi]|nr:hypothetical protein ON010_g17823 [Phytophthora cinnamomi]
MGIRSFLFKQRKRQKSVVNTTSPGYPEVSVVTTSTTSTAIAATSASTLPTTTSVTLTLAVTTLAGSTSIVTVAATTRLLSPQLSISATISIRSTVSKNARSAPLPASCVFLSPPPQGKPYT